MLVARSEGRNAEPFISLVTARLRLRWAAHDLLGAMLTALTLACFKLAPQVWSSVQFIRIRALGCHADTPSASSQV
jgi:hypothetical protein